MSIKLNGAYPTRNNSGLAGRAISNGFVPVTEPWVRNPSWPACEAVSGSNKIVGLYAVFPGDGTGAGGNFFAVTISGAYTIDYGDGTITNYTSGNTAYYEFDYNDADLAGTNAPVTFTASTNTVNRTAHGYSDGMTVKFYNIVTTTGLSENTPYYVINATANTFQVSTTVGGSAVVLTNDGSATLLPYKIATVTITPQVGQDLTSVDFGVKHNQSGLVSGYSVGWLDIAIAGASITSLIIGGTIVVKRLYLERVRLNQLGNILSFSTLFQFCLALRNVVIADSITSVTSTINMFATCYALTEVPLFNTANVTNMSNMFQNCYSLTSVPLFNTTASVSMSNMFQNCYSLQSVPLFATANVTNMSAMFSACYSLQSVPLFNTANVTNMSTMFGSCYSLITVPLFNTANVTDMSIMFNACSDLVSVPLFNTVKVTTMSSMFNGCSFLTKVPLFNTAAVTNMGSMFANCYSLKTVPLFNTAAVTNMSSMFSFCNSLQSVPLFNTAAVTNMSSMFFSCFVLASIPLFNTAAVTNMTSMFNACNGLTSVPAIVTTAVTSSTSFGSMFLNCNSLTRIQAKNFRFTFSVASCKLSSTALNEIYTNLPTVTSQTITVTGNYGTAGDTPSIATGKGWTVTG